MFLRYWKQEDVRKAIYIRIVSGLVLSVVGGIITAVVLMCCD